MNAFWVLVSRKTFDVMKFRSLFFRMVEKSFPMHEVSEIGLKLTGSLFLLGVKYIVVIHGNC